MKVKEEHLGTRFLGQRFNLGKGEDAGRLVAGGGGGDEVVLAMVVDRHGVVIPRDARLKAVEPGFAKNGIEALEGGGVEGIGVGVGGEGEVLPREEKRAGLGGAIGEVDDVRCELGGSREQVTSEEG